MNCTMVNTDKRTLPSQYVDQKSNENKQKNDRQRALALFAGLSNEINKNESL